MAELTVSCPGCGAMVANGPSFGAIIYTSTRLPDGPEPPSTLGPTTVPHVLSRPNGGKPLHGLLPLADLLPLR
jgi:hypothetical protein